MTKPSSHFKILFYQEIKNKNKKATITTVMVQGDIHTSQ